MDTFAIAIQAAERDLGCKGIGTLGETSLHLTLKYYFAPNPATHEIPFVGFIADAVTEDGVIEIQTRNLARLKPKLTAFLPLCPVTIVFPVAVNKWVIAVDADGVVQSKRRSPKHESLSDTIWELYGLRDLIAHPNLRIRLCMLELAEYRCKTGKSKRERGERIDRVPLALVDMLALESPLDYRMLLPEHLPEAFTVQDIAKESEFSVESLRMLLHLLERMGYMAKVGKRCRATVWQSVVPSTVSDIMGR